MVCFSSGGERNEVQMDFGLFSQPQLFEGPLRSTKSSLKTSPVQIIKLNLSGSTPPEYTHSCIEM